MPAHTWQRSSFCGQGESCIYVARTTPTTLQLTESSDPTGAILDTTPAAFAALLRTIHGERDVRTTAPLTVTHRPDGTVLVTDTTAATVVTTTVLQWRAFTRGVRAGEFDHFAALNCADSTATSAA